MKSKFLTLDKPPLVAMVQEQTADGAVAVIMNSHFEGAEAFGIQLCNLSEEYRNPESLTKIFKACYGKPIYITSYRSNKSATITDDERAELLLMGLRAGASLCDVMGDFFCAEENQFTYDEIAVKKQKALIDEIHSLGGEVVISTHLRRYYEADEVIALAKAQIERGADIVKIVNLSNSEEQEKTALDLIVRMKNELERPFLYLVSGTHSALVRRLGAIFGSCMYLCVERYLPVTTKAQPLLKSAKGIRDNILF